MPKKPRDSKGGFRWKILLNLLVYLMDQPEIEHFKSITITKVSQGRVDHTAIVVGKYVGIKGDFTLKLQHLDDCTWGTQRKIKSKKR